MYGQSFIEIGALHVRRFSRKLCFDSAFKVLHNHMQTSKKKHWQCQKYCQWDMIFIRKFHALT